MKSHQQKLSRRVERIASDKEHVVSTRRPSRKVRRLLVESQLLTVGSFNVHDVDLTDPGCCAGEDDVAAIADFIVKHCGLRTRP